MKNLSLQLFQNEMLLHIILYSSISLGILYIVFSYCIHKKKIKATFHGYTLIDLRNILMIVCVYTIISFTSFGSFTMPTSTWQPTSTSGHQDVVFHFTDDTTFSAIYTFYGEGDNNALDEYYQLGTTNMQIYGSNDNQTWEYIRTLDSGSIYQYEINEGTYTYSYIWIRSTSKYNSLSEIGFLSKDGTYFLPLEIEMDGASDSAYPATLLIDEQDKLFISPTYEDEGYFDEVYHPRNAWEIANGQDMYATVHPLLGTNIMSLGIKLLGMSPFSWRLAGGIFGVLLVILMYMCAHALFQSTMVSTIATLLLSFDFMHLTTSRIGTLEPFSVFFILLMFYYMIRYIKLDFVHTPYRKHLRYLLQSGIAMGLAIATKWTGCYSAIGLAILLFAYWIHTGYTQYKSRNDNSTNWKIYVNRLWKTILLCFVFFILIPIVIYFISYIPDRVWKGDSWSIGNVISQIQYMYNYHATLEATHPYSSVWYQWLIDARPIWYYIGTSADGLVHSISCFSNPLLTWFGIPAILYTCMQCFRKKDQTAWIILVGYITALAPWVIITRCVFAYHFYPTSLFLVLACAYTLRDIYQCGKWGRYFVYLFMVGYVIVFIAFLPVTAGFGTSYEYIRKLEWFSSWYFGAAK